MKTLNQHIQEKLIINKNFKNTTYCCVEPHSMSDNDFCLCIVFDIFDKDRDYVSLYPIKYRYYDGDDGVFIQSCAGSENYDFYNKHENGYYYYYEGKFWLDVILFADDALTLLEKVLKNRRQKIDVKEFAGDLLKTDNTMFFCKFDNDESPVKFYSERQIQNMIKKIK